VQLEISDNGRGIAKSHLGNVITGNVGVGIARMRERVRELGGSIEIRSDETGTILVVSIPAASANAEQGSNFNGTAAS
jgi:signal transduction histidine kinase